MNKIYAVLICLFMSDTIFAQSGQNQAIDKIFKSYFQSDEPGASLAVVQNGKIIYNKGIGLKELTAKDPIDEYTNYRIGSVSKQFTAMAVMMLKEKGLLKYEDKINKYFPELPNATRNITIRNLLNHTSGIVEYDTLCSDYPYQMDDYQIFNLVKEYDDLYFPSGTEFKYSNTAYILLGLLVEKVGRQDFSDFLQNNIFKPLKMNETMMYNAKKEIPERAWGHVFDKDDKRLIEEDQSPTSALRGDGAIYTSVMDYLKWEKALSSNQLVSYKTMKEALTPPKNIDYPKHPYGFGWYVVSTSEGKVMYHKGETMGFQSFVRRNEEKKYAIIILANRDDVDLEKLSYKISRVLLGEE